MDNPLMVSGRLLLDFFEAKHRAWASSLFEDVCHKVIRRSLALVFGDGCRGGRAVSCFSAQPDGLQLPGFGMLGHPVVVLCPF